MFLDFKIRTTTTKKKKKSFARYHQIINIEFHKLSSYFSYNITELNKKHECSPYYENSLNIINDFNLDSSKDLSQNCQISMILNTNQYLLCPCS